MWALKECEVEEPAGYQLRGKVSFQGGNISRGRRLGGGILVLGTFSNFAAERVANLSSCLRLIGN